MMFKVKAKFDKNAKKYFDVYINIDKINYIAKDEVMLDKGLCYLDETSLAEVTRYIDFTSLLKKAFTTMDSKTTANNLDALKNPANRLNDNAKGNIMQNVAKPIENKQSSTKCSIFKKIWRRIVEKF